MKTILALKVIGENIPYSIGKFASYIPFSLRLGRDYTRFRQLLEDYEHAYPNVKLEFTLSCLNKIVKFAQNYIPFYQRLYGRSAIQINTLSDFKALPTITKAQVRGYSEESNGAMLVNTGGTCGEPLSLYLDEKAWAREWAHMHCIWGLRGYKPTDLMMTMLGKSLGNRLYRYNAVYNEIKINPYVFSRYRAAEIYDLFKKYPIKYYQGYPSSIYNLFRELDNSLEHEKKQYISSRIRSLFFSSEYPLPYMVDYLKSVWGFNYISWYGHSEMCVLAYDMNNDNRYRPFTTYGYAENVDGKLHGTSFHNYAMPLIRYSTGDLIESKEDDAGLIEYFSIEEGREGDFIEDKHGKKISLTALVFGRHHKIFNLADYLQVSQEDKGQITFLITLKGTQVAFGEVRSYFDLDGLAINSRFIFLKKPILSKAGKLRLRVTVDEINERKLNTE
ncbi:MAG: phenylacetate--CoA ligase family protein [Syntrophorhabdaceae bacterium]